MKITYFSSNDEVLKEIGNRIKNARINMSLTQKELAEKTNLSQRTISNLEMGKDVSFSTVIDVLRSLNKLQSMELLIPEAGIRPSDIVSLGKPRQRASKRRNTKEKSGWKWGDEE